MPINAQAEEFFGAGEVRSALEHMAASAAFRGSPQLVAFLRYVVEATLRGEADRIKGYTIAVEAFGRAEHFDPQSDPIVRVEATRLRRALNRYYASAGESDPVLIDLPLGSYVPVFRRRAAYPVPAVPSAALPAQARWRDRLAIASAHWRRGAIGAVLVLFGAVGYGALDVWFDFNTPNPQPMPTLLAAQTPTVSESPRWHSAYPVVFVGPFQAAGNGPVMQSSADMLRVKLRDALARFDEIHVLTEAPPAGEHYRLTASAEYDAAGMIGLAVRLTDAADGSLAYVRSFSATGRAGDSMQDESAIVREVAAVLAQPYGIIQARERARDVQPGDGRYRCLLEAYDYWRNFDPAQHQRARDCLERSTRSSPDFALGFAALATILLEENRNGIELRPGDAPALQRALQAARRAVELRPGSARAHQALANVQFARGDYPLAIEAGERAITLNPYDPNILADHGADLVALGEGERGARLIKAAAAAIIVRPAWHDFFLFLTAYLAGDQAGAARHAAMIASDTYSLGLVARALVAAQQGEIDHARQLLGRLAAGGGTWRDDLRGALKRFFPANSIVDRLEHDLGRIREVPGQ